MSQVGEFTNSDFSERDWRASHASPSDPAADLILVKLQNWTAAHFHSSDYPDCPVCQKTKWTWDARVQTSARGRRSVYRICDGCGYAMRFDPDAIGI
jgi:hypothetical protein